MGMEAMIAMGPPIEESTEPYRFMSPPLESSNEMLISELKGLLEALLPVFAK